MALLRFLHLPKTGGSSLRESFIHYFGSRAIMDYNNIRHPALVGVDPEVEPERAKAVFKDLDAQIVVGHSWYNRYAHIVRPEDTIVFLREPVTQVVSHFHHMVRTERYEGSLEDFAYQNQNTQTQLIQELPLGLAFVGIFERYDESVRQLNARYGLDLVSQQTNINPDKPFKEAYPLDTKTRALLESLNTHDIALYDRMLLQFVAKEVALNKPWSSRRTNRTRWSVIANTAEADRIRGTTRSVETFSLAKAFDHVYQTEQWGRGAGSGEGSDPTAAMPYIDYVERFVREKGIQTVLDCGCGDLQIASNIRWGSAQYQGIDVSAEALKLAAPRAAAAGLKLEHASADSRSDWAYDLALVKEVLQHLSFADIQKTLKCLSGCKYILAVNDVKPGVKTPDILSGGYRAVDIREAPICVEAEVVLQYVVEGNTKQVLLIKNDV